MPAEVKVLIEGYTNADSKAESGEKEKTCPTISLVRDGDLVIVVDPGVLDSQQILVGALQKEGLSVDDVNMVCITHSHIDHYRNIGMFSEAKTLEYFGVWDKGACEDWQEQFTPNIQILKTPGHDYTSITLFVKTDEGVVAICGDVFWKNNFPENDQNSKNKVEVEELKESRKLVLEMADWVVPGHAGMYKIKNGNKGSDGENLLSNNKKEAKVATFCRKCRKSIKTKRESCRCRPYLCCHCCECGIDCDLCGCSHREK